MEHNHSDHNHEGHRYSHVPKITSLNKAFGVGIILNLTYVLIQIVIGLKINSLSLLSDAGHNFLDVAGLALAMLAFKLSKSKATEIYTYGWKKASILISLVNGVVLLISIGAIGYEAIFRFQNPQPLPGVMIAVIAGIGIIINGVSAFMFFRDKDQDINVKAAFLHLASDALVSLGLVAGGIIIYYTHLYWVDPLLSLIICGVIIVSTWNLLRDSLRLSLDGVPNGIELQKVKEVILNIEGVKGFHHLHIWAISTSQNALTGHLVVANEFSNDQVLVLKNKIKDELAHLSIQHVTLETEVKDCNNEDCGAG
ncbi:MAG: cation diffusion facilitator family transporter [Candidatus Pedobacter colombiensis]|uniref:Cation diffusion facilitator family transporter n=1 Tax=Candidatus Pedobacter colombiensis TaxID=3121371 RepID=A0AAJ5WDT0_9SPHI|nr:cation diffusion facilitator family transporter [Pedobacter sp.]WEK21670.1 MAG: cation diffusion facilitator family transporter [Pedobacter sp.]